MASDRKIESSKPQDASYGAVSPLEDAHTVSIEDDPAFSSPITSSLLLRPPSNDSKEENGSTKASSHLNGQGSHHILQSASISSTIVNITKNLIGGGVLSLSGGIAMFADSRKAAVPAILWVIVLGALLGYFCLLIGKICATTQSSSYREAWEKTVGRRGGRMVAIANTLDPLLGIFANASIMAQSFQSILEAVGIHWTVVECLLLITVVAILPLCLMKSLSALAPFSAVGLAAVLFTLGVMVLRCLEGSYRPGGVFYGDLPEDLRPAFGTQSRPWSIDALPYVCMVFTSFDMHYNSPRFYTELRHASISRFGTAVFYSFGAGSVLLFSIAIAGFLTFGASCNSFILENYSPHDPLATLCRLAIGFCALTAYPLNFIGVRDNCLDIIGIADKIDTAAKLNSFTIVLLSILTVTNCFVTDLGLINSVGGGTTVTLVDFVFPAFMFRALIQNKPGHGTASERLEARVVMALMAVAVVLGLIGVWVSIDMALDQQR